MRSSRVALVFFTLVLFVAVLVPRRAFADASGVQVAVLAFDSEDAEDQADAFTGALRSRIRASQGWSLIETSHSLGMLTAALKCPARPTPECQQRIGEQVKADRYIWGYVTKGPQSGQVTAEIHLYQKGKPDTVLKENYADNLRDQNDDTLRKIAQRVLDRLGGSTVGVVIVRGAADMDGEVIVDGEKRGRLAGGQARLELGPGSHSVEIVSSSGESTKRNVLVTSGAETVLELEAAAPPPGPEVDKPFPTKKVVGGVALGGGVILGALAIQQFLFYNELQDRGEEIAQVVPQGKAPCETENEHFCNVDKRARTASALAIASASVGAIAIGTGIYLLFVSPDTSSERGPTTAKRSKPRFSPTFGPHGAGFSLSGAF